MGVLVRDDGVELVIRQRVQYPLGQHDPALSARDAVRRRRGVLEDTHPVAVVGGDDVDELSVVRADPAQPRPDAVARPQQSGEHRRTDEEGGDDELGMHDRVVPVEE